MHTCKGACDNLEGYKVGAPRIGLYSVENGWKKCTICNIITKGEETRCKCCGSRFRLRKKK